MTLLEIFPATGDIPPLPQFSSNDVEHIRDALAERGISFERWPARVKLSEEASPAEILEAYAPEIAQVQATGRYPTVDAIRLKPDHPDRDTLRKTFLAEHTHNEDEVRFFVEGQGLFCLHIGEEVLQVLCNPNDFLKVPAGTKHWFDMGAAPQFTAIRFFDNPEGWVAHFTGDPIADRYPRLQEASASGASG